MKRHFALLAFGVLVAGSVTYAQITPHASPSSVLSSASQSSTTAAAPAAPASNISSIAKPSVTGGGESDD